MILWISAYYRREAGLKNCYRLARKTLSVHLWKVYDDTKWNVSDSVGFFWKFKGIKEMKLQKTPLKCQEPRESL